MTRLLYISLLALAALLSMISTTRAQSVVDSWPGCASGVESANKEGLKYDKKGEYEKALAAYLKAARIDPTCADVYNNIGTAYYLLKRFDEAIKAYQQAIDLSSNLAWIYHYNLGRAYAASSHYEEAIKAYSESIRLKSNFPKAYSGRGSVYRYLGEYQRAIEDFTESIRRGNKESSVYQNRAWHYLYLGRGEAAVDDARHFIDLKGWKDKASPYVLLIYYFGSRQANHSDDARKILDEAVGKIDSTSWPYPVVRYLRKEITSQDLLSSATDNEKMAEARTYIGLELSLSGQRDEAMTNLRWVKENGKRTLYEYDLALSELRRMETSVAGSNRE